MINIYLCEDDKLQLDYWIEIINNYLQMNHLNEHLVCAVQSPDELLNTLNLNPNIMGLYFLDICLNAKLNGLQLAVEIRKRDPIGEIVFITSRSEMCYMTYEYQVRALDFIIKDNISDLPQKIKKCLVAASIKEKQIKELTCEPLYLKISGEWIYFNPDDILYIETSKNAVHKIMIHTLTGFESTYGTLKEMDKTFKKYSCFCRCHKSVIVNKKHITNINSKSKEITLSNSTIIPVSIRYLQSITSSINLIN